MVNRIIRGVRVAGPTGIGPASVHIAAGQIVAVARYEEVPRGSVCQELSKSLLMPGLRAFTAKSEATNAFSGGLTAPLITDAGGDKLQGLNPDFLLPALWTRARQSDIRIDPFVESLRQESNGVAFDGSVEEGFPANLVIWNPEVALPSHPGLYGLVRETLLGGKTVYQG